MELKLYEISSLYREALDNIVCDPDTGEVFGLEELDKIESDLTDKAEAVAIKILEFEAHRTALASEKERITENLTKRISQDDSTIKKLKNYLNFEMSKVGKKTIENEKIKIVAKMSESVKIDDGAEIPPEYIRTTVKQSVSPDKIALKNYLKSGGKIEGVTLEKNRTVSIE